MGRLFSKSIACVLILYVSFLNVACTNGGDSDSIELVKLLKQQEKRLDDLEKNIYKRFDETQKKIVDVNEATDSLKMEFSSKLIAAMADLGNDVSGQSNDFMKRMDVLEGGLRQRLRNIATRTNKCPSDYMGNAHGCYKFYIGHTCWQDAKRRCRDDGANLVIIETESEMKALQMLIRMNGFTDNWFWIGGSDKRKEGDWVWEATGQPLTYTNWRKGFPNGGAAKNCLRMTSFSYYKNQWDDQPCTQCFRDFICEMKTPRISA